jgi:hypothetical protein
MPCTAASRWNSGTAIINVVSDTFGVIEETDCVLRTYTADDAVFHRGQGILDVGFNAGEGDVVAYVTFMGVPPGQPATIGVPHEEAPCWGGRRLWLSALRMVGGRRPLQRWRPRRLHKPFMAAPYGRPP